jgi:ketosteroid isomerase-like protein
MNNWMAGVAMGCMAAAAGASDGGAAQLSAAEREVLAAEDAYVAAEVARDLAVLQRIVDERFTFNRSDGTTTGKAELIEGVMGMRMAGQDITDRTVMVEGDVGLIFGSADIRFVGDDGTETLGRYRYTSAYVKRDGEWKFLALQMTGRPKQE